LKEKSPGKLDKISGVQAFALKGYDNKKAYLVPIQYFALPA